MTSCNHMCFRSCNGSQEPFFNNTMLGLNSKGVTRLSPHGCYPSLACSIPRFVSNRAYLRSFGTASWAAHEFERTDDKVTANVERDVSGTYYTKRVCLDARSYRIVHSR
ncbi:uncharacterized protein TNCV_3718001 [Trichonephila clavipes]|nr:uncharacterized protein TNCV_3718001 [Trichonephila clavipes]